MTGLFGHVAICRAVHAQSAGRHGVEALGNVFDQHLAALTAADYVIHLDPWRNPAVEDQASDRAYRIGQQRPPAPELNKCLIPTPCAGRRQTL